MWTTVRNAPALAAQAHLQYLLPRQSDLTSPFCSRLALNHQNLAVGVVLDTRCDRPHTTKGYEHDFLWRAASGLRAGLHAH